MDIVGLMESLGTSNVPFIAAFFIGLMTSLSPCPLATNVTAIAYISRNIHSKRISLLMGLLYTLGRAFAYVALAFAIISIGIEAREISWFLQQYGEKLLGPLLIFIGVLMLGLVHFEFPRIEFLNIESLKKIFAQGSLAGSFGLGVVFALAFCPFSAVLYFGMLLPLSIRMHDPLVLPALFAFGTGIPVILFSLITAYCFSSLGKYLKKTEQIERYVRTISGIAFIVIGLYCTCVSYISTGGV